MSKGTVRPPMPANLCLVLEIKRLVTLGVLDGVVGTVVDEMVFTGDRKAGRQIKVPFRLVKSSETAILTVGTQNFVLTSWPMQGGRRFWQAECPDCGRACRKLWCPKDRSEWLCVRCHRVITPGRRRAIDRFVERPISPAEQEASDWVERRMQELSAEQGTRYQPWLYQ